MRARSLTGSLATHTTDSYVVERPWRSLQAAARSRHTAPRRSFIIKLHRGIAIRIGFIGVGNMGTPMALRLLAAGHELSVWNRSEGRTKPLIHQGAVAAATPAEAELGAEAVITMLLDDSAYEEVLLGVHRLIDALSPGVLHILCGTISVTLGEQLTAEHARRGIDFVAARVFGQARDAEAGQLSIVAAGEDEAINRARPLLEAFSSRITVVGKDPWQAYALKLEEPMP